MFGFDRRLAFFWALLVAATLISWGSSDSSAGAFHWAAVFIIVIAFVKVRYVGLEFMELRHAPVALRIGFEAWVSILPAILVALYAFRFG